jgi:pimeloyl-ACP methyl ester carboxylesterase
MKRHVLVHGAWEGAWSWENVVPLLEEAGHVVLSVELPGSSSHMKALDEVTLESYVSAVATALEGSDDQVVLAGHSLGGTVISQFAERFPERVDRLVFVTAFLIGNGSNALETMQSDADGQLLPRLVFSEDQSYATATEDVWRKVAFHDARAAAIEAALPRLTERQSTEPFVANLELSESRFGSVLKTYIRTSLDRVLSPALQDRMLSNWPVDDVVTLEAGHFPALSMLEVLAGALLSAGVAAEAVSSVQG